MNRVFLWAARILCAATLASILHRNYEAGEVQLLPFVMLIALVLSFLAPHLRQKSSVN